MNREPVLTAASIAAGLTAIVALLKSFGVPISDDQAVALTGVVGVFAPIVLALVARNKVTPVEPAARNQYGAVSWVAIVVVAALVLVLLILFGAFNGR